MSVVAIAAVVAAYLLGTFPSALLAGRRRGVDPTQSGSGNPGTTNVLRTAGRQAAALTLVGDLGKGVVAAALGWAVGGHGLGVACGVAAVVGHVAPVTRGFRGGKGVATGAGMLLVLYPLLVLVAALAFAMAFAVTRIISVGSLTAAVTVPVAAAIGGVPGRELAGLVVCGVLVVGRHADNIRRIARGQEPGATLRR
ncbi:MAG TPA: glycerol-3-phosphate 1-O-acyltransferase PlsY [Acidimicrobiales bacterium]|nr:glycerol-3-phosphate 1-O-acyltransferase PlsY [Acidimicrobiales bacterium]